MHFDTLLLGGTLWSSSGPTRADLGIRDEKIAEIGELSSRSAREIVDCNGLDLMPGIIDTQVHFREPGLEHKEDIESGSRAALHGGVTTFFEMPNTAPPTTDADALNDKLQRASGRSWVNYAFFVGATSENADRCVELEMLPGTPGIKIFMGSSTGSLLVPDDDTLERIFRSCKRRCPVHAEDHYCLEAHKRPTNNVRDHYSIRDSECALKATQRLVSLARKTGGKPHILHVSTAEELPVIYEAKRELPITCEVTPPHLWVFSDDCYERLGTLAQMNPPIRTREHREAIREALRNGLFDVFGSDHAPHTLEEKSSEYPKSPSGMPGVQTLLPAMLTLAQEDGLISVADVVRLGCEAPTRLYDIQGKGKLSPGFDADIVAVDLRKRWQFQREDVESKCGWSPFEGEAFTGQVVHVWVNGSQTVCERERIGSPMGKVVRFDRG